MTTAPHTRVGGGSARVVGATALALAASLIVQNVVVGAGGAPDYGDPIADVLAFHAKNRGAVAIAVGLEALNLPLLLGFLAGLHGLVASRTTAGATWSRLALAAGATLSAIWAIYAVAWIGAVLSVGEPAAAVEPRGGSFVDEPQRVGSNRLAHGGTHEVAGGCRRVVPGAVHLVVTVG